MVGKQWLKSLPVALSLHGTYDSKRCYVVALPKTLLIAAIFVTFMNSKPLSRPVARFFGNGLLSYLRPRIQSICVNLYPTNPAAVDDNLCDTIERDSVDPGGIAVMVSGTKLPPPRSMNEMLEAEEVGLVLVILNSRVTVSPGMTGSSMNSLLSLGTGSTERLSRAGLPTAVSPAMVAVMSLVAF